MALKIDAVLAADFYGQAIGRNPPRVVYSSHSGGSMGKSIFKKCNKDSR